MCIRVAETVLVFMVVEIVLNRLVSRHIHVVCDANTQTNGQRESGDRVIGPVGVGSETREGLLRRWLWAETHWREDPAMSRPGGKHPRQRGEKRQRS